MPFQRQYYRRMEFIMADVMEISGPTAVAKWMNATASDDCRRVSCQRSANGQKAVFGSRLFK